MTSLSDDTMLKPGIYKHYKGNEYEVIDVARHSETEELLVVYRPMYGERALWVRPLAMFQECVELCADRAVGKTAAPYQEGLVETVTVPRFQYLRDSD